MHNDSFRPRPSGFIRALIGIAMTSALLALSACAGATSSKGSDSGPNQFTGTWVQDMGPNSSREYVFFSDMSFEYTETNNGTVINRYKGTYAFQAPSSYTEHVTHQDMGAGFVALGAGAWQTNYTYSVDDSTLQFDDGNGYAPTFEKSLGPT